MPTSDIGPATHDDAHPNPSTEHHTADIGPTLLARLDTLNDKVTDHLDFFSNAAPKEKYLASALLDVATSRIRLALEQLADAEGHVATTQARFDHLSKGEMVELIKARMSKKDATSIIQNIRDIELNRHQELDIVKKAIENELEILRSTVGKLEPALKDIIAKPDVASETQPSREEQDSRAAIQALHTEIRALSERLGQPSAPADSAPPATDSPTIAGLRLGHIDPEKFRNESGLLYNAFKDTAALYRSLQDEPGNPTAQLRFELLRHALDNPQIRGNGALEKVANLHMQVVDYQGSEDPRWIQMHGSQGSLPNLWIQEDHLSEDTAYERWYQLDFALHATDEQIAEHSSNPRVTFLGWRNNPS